MELQTTTGLRSDGAYVLVDNVERGKACDCVCPACKTPLIARQGQKVRWHFAHESSANITRHCAESDLHLSVKLGIAKSKSLSVPKMFDYSGKCPSFVKFAKKYYGWDIFSPKILKFDSVKIESKKDAFIPDLIAYTNNVEYLIEVVVTHDIDEYKMDWIKSSNLNCIRIYPKKEYSDWVWSNLSELSLENKMQNSKYLKVCEENAQLKEKNKTLLVELQEYENTLKNKAIKQENETLKSMSLNSKYKIECLEDKVSSLSVQNNKYASEIDRISLENKSLSRALNSMQLTNNQPNLVISELHTEIELLRRECGFKDKIISNMKSGTVETIKSATPWRSRR